LWVAIVALPYLFTGVLVIVGFHYSIEILKCLNVIRAGFVSVSLFFLVLFFLLPALHLAIRQQFNHRHQNASTNLLF
jgi:hypothetical protein